MDLCAFSVKQLVHDMLEDGFGHVDEFDCLYEGAD